jgi:hypothetical protein
MRTENTHLGHFISDNRVSGGELFEADVLVCSHCQRAAFKNPARVRPRAKCLKCNAYICDLCEGERVRTGECKPFRQVIEELQEREFVALNLSQV